MDGTLMDATHLAVSPRNQAALRRCAERGIHVVLASGRPHALVEGTAAELGCVRYAITANGGAVWDLLENRRLVDRSIPEETTARVLRILLDYPIAVEVYCGGRAWVDPKTWRLDRYEKQPRSFLRFRAAHNVEADDLAAALAGKRAEKFNVDGMPRDVLSAVLKRLEPLQGELAVNFIDCYDNLEISRADATKGAALADLCAALGVAREETAAFGDSDNDADMLRWAGESFAMAGGEPAALEAAKHVTAPSTEDGVAQAIERFILNE